MIGPRSLLRTLSISAWMLVTSAALTASCSMACSSETASLGPLVTWLACREWGSRRLSILRSGPTLSMSAGRQAFKQELPKSYDEEMHQAPKHAARDRSGLTAAQQYFVRKLINLSCSHPVMLAET